MSYDVIVIGAGHNGLVAAAQVAKAGRKVLVLEKRDRPGGLCAREEFHPGYRIPGVLHDESMVRAGVVDTLGLEKHGLGFKAEPPPVHLPGGVVLTRENPRGLSQKDAVAYADWRAFFGRVRSFLAEILNSAPPPLVAKGTSDLFTLGKRGLALRRLGKKDMLEVLRVAPMCVADFLNESFESSALVEALAAPAVQHTFMGPWSAGSAANLLIRECVTEKPLSGGPAALVDALMAAAKERNVEVRTEAAVKRIRLERGKVTGVELENGDAIDAPIVASAADPKTTFLDLIHPRDLELQLEFKLKNFRTRGTAAKMHLALNAPLEMNGEAAEVIRIGGGHVDELERAFDAIKYGEASKTPHLEVTVPSMSIPMLAPEGHHVASIVASYTPYGGDREAFGEAILAQLEKHIPDVRERIVASEVLLPEDLEQRYGINGGHLHHGEHTLDQLLFMRPNTAMSRYATPIAGLFLAGSGSHPGGGVTGAPGALAAQAIIKG